MKVSTDSPTAQSGPSASLHARAEALYIAFTDNHPTIHCNRFPAWRELSNAAKREWMDKAAIAADHPTAGEKENATPPAGARDAVTGDMVERACVSFLNDWSNFHQHEREQFRKVMRAALGAALAGKTDGTTCTQRNERVLAIQLREVETAPADSYMRGLYNGMLMICCNEDGTDYQPAKKPPTQPAATGAGEGPAYRVLQCPNCPTSVETKSQDESIPCIRCGAYMDEDATAKPLETNAAATGMGDVLRLADRMRSCCKDAPMRDSDGADTLDSWVMRWQEELRALAAQPAPVEAERGLHTNRREQAVQYMLAEGWKWDGSAWCREPTAQPAPVVGGDGLRLHISSEWMRRGIESDGELEPAASSPLHESRFFIDHGIVHDRKTGKHLRGTDEYGNRASDLLAVLQELEGQALLAARPGGEDSARLDWLDANEADLVTHRESENAAGEYSIWWNVAKRGESISGHPLGYAREAIDAAMKAHPAQAGGGRE